MNLFNNNDSAVLITGGAGFIGSHFVARCLEEGINFIVIDNLSNSSLDNLISLENLFNKKIKFYNFDIRNKQLLENVFIESNIKSIVHFAGLKSVAESVKDPNLYFDNNVNGSKNIIELSKLYDIKNIIFSSSATVYGIPKYLPIDEAHPTSPINPYGQTKLDIENLFINDNFFDSNCSVIILRYFNPIGSYKKIIGEKPNNTPANLIPYIVGVAERRFENLKIFGDDYPTKDGTGIRDYIHVMDLVDAHLVALKQDKPGCQIYNIGCGKGFSVLEIIKTFENTHNISIPFVYFKKREGDVASCYADVKKAKSKLKWEAKFNIVDMCEDSWIKSK